MNKVMIIGSGQLGSRHLQGLARIDIPISVSVVDPLKKSLDVAKERFMEINESCYVKEINFYTRIDQADKKQDLVILATTADIRAKVTKELLEKVEVKYIIFEKVVFQSIKDFQDISYLLKTMEVKAWVNCTRRIYPFYRELKKIFDKNEKICYCVQGGDWELACNAIHFIDHVAFFTGNYDYTLDIYGLDNVIQDSRREGFIEITGSIRGFMANGSEFILYSMHESLAPHIINILAKNFKIIIDENKGLLNISKAENNWKWEEKRFRIPYQSELTNKIVKNILLKKTCGLTSFDNSYKLHKIFLIAVLKHIKRITGKSLESCPIT